MIQNRFLFSLAGLGLIALFGFPQLSSAADKNDGAKEGALLFRDKGCTFCHGVGGVGTNKGPAVNEIWKDKSWTSEKIAKQILDGGQKMPPFRESVTDEEASQLVAYLRAKDKPTPPAAAEEATPTSPQQ